MGSVGFGVLTGLLGFSIAMLVFCSSRFEDLSAKIHMFVFLILTLIFFLSGYIGSASVVNANTQQFCASFEAQKKTYESAIINEDITGLERLQITQNIMELNGQLASEQVSVIQWYSFDISQKSRNNVLSLTSIK